jgi:hypothetical protein
MCRFFCLKKRYGSGAYPTHLAHFQQLASRTHAKLKQLQQERIELLTYPVMYRFEVMFERFCVSGETDISNASRGIKNSEVESCRSIGQEPIEFRVGTDAIAVSVSTDNDFATDVTAEELAAIFNSAETWADVQADWPAEPIQHFIPCPDSGTLCLWSFCFTGQDFFVK